MLLYIFVVLVKLIVLHICTIGVFIINISGLYATDYYVDLTQCQHDYTPSCGVKYTYLF